MQNKKEIKRIILSFIVGVAGAIVSNLLPVPLLIRIGITFLSWLGAFLYFSPESVKPIPKNKEMTLEDYLEYAKETANYLNDKSKKIENEKLAEDVRGISDKIFKINDALKNNPEKLNEHKKIFSYYIPTTIKLIDKYDEIENQQLTSKDSIEYMKKVESMFSILNNAFQNMLNSIYSFDILDQSADLEVLNNFLKTEALKNEK